MKTKNTTDPRSPQGPTAEHAATASESGTKRIPTADQQAAVTYPELEGMVPDDCFTTQDPPAYGNSASNEDE